MSDYAKGFKDGFAVGLDEGKKIIEEQWRKEKINEIEKSLPKPLGWPSTSPNLTIHETCPKCGIRIDRPMGYVCSSPNCPTFPKVTSVIPEVTSVVTGQLANATMGFVSVQGYNAPNIGPDPDTWYENSPFKISGNIERLWKD